LTSPSGEEALLAPENLLPTRISWRGCPRLATRRVLCLFFAIVFYLSGAGSRATAQAPGAGANAGTVSDPSGAAGPNAGVSVVNEAPRFIRNAITSLEGSFRSALLPPGTYTLTVDAPGFGQQVLHSLRVQAGETTIIDIKLKLGATSDVVEVSESVEL